MRILQSDRQCPSNSIDARRQAACFRDAEVAEGGQQGKWGEGEQRRDGRWPGRPEFGKRRPEARSGSDKALVLVLGTFPCTALGPWIN